MADARFCFPLPEGYSDLQVAPLLCAGPDRPPGASHDWRRRAPRPLRLRRRGARRSRRSPRSRGGGCSPSAAPATRRRRSWPAGSAPSGPAAPTGPLPEELDAAIIFAPAGELVPAGAARRRRGEASSSAPASTCPTSRGFPYADLWGERTIRSVANLTRADAREFLALAPARAGADRDPSVPPRGGRAGARRPARGAIHRRSGTAALTPGRSRERWGGRSRRRRAAARAPAAARRPRCRGGRPGAGRARRARGRPPRASSRARSPGSRR